MKENSFDGIIGGESYALFMEAYPHFTELQQGIANAVRDAVTPHNGLVNVLELGCGPGPTTEKLLQSDNRFEIYAIDIESKMIDQAKINLAKYDGRVHLIQADALSHLSEYDDNTFDAFASGWTLHNFTQTEREELLPEIKRVLKPGGVFVNGDKYALDDLNARESAYQWSLNRLNEIGAKYNNLSWSKKWCEHMAFDETPDIIMPKTKAINQLRDIGFVDVQTIYRQQMESIVRAYKPIS